MGPKTLGHISRVLTPLVPAVTVLVLGTLAVHQWRAEPEPDGARAADGARWTLADALPVSRGAWVGEPWHPVEPGRPLLRDVQRQGRVYEHVETGRRAAVLMVRAGDWRDLLGYNVPQWYADRGWQVLEQRQVTWRVRHNGGSVSVPAIEHELSAPGRRGPSGAALGEAGSQLAVTSFVVDAEGRLRATLEPDRLGDRLAVGGLRHGDAQALVHVAFGGDVPRRERESAIDDLMRALILSIERERGGGDKP